MQDNTTGNSARRKGLTAMDGAMALVIVLLIVQMWLLAATLEAFLGGDREGILPAAILSGLILLVCGGLYLFVVRIDSDRR